MSGQTGSEEVPEVKVFGLVTKNHSILGGQKVTIIKELKDTKSGNRVICVERGLIEKIQKVYGGEISEIEADVQSDLVIFRRNGRNPVPLFQRGDFKKLIGGFVLFGRVFFAADHNLVWA